MNLGSILSGTLDLLFGGSSDRGKNVSSDDSYTNVSGALDNVLAKLSGSRLTDAEREANAFTAQREDLAWQRQMYASNTAYQRQVADMQAAGLNPMLALGAGGASSPSVSSSGSVSPAGGSFNLGTLLSLIMLPSQLKSMKAERESMAASAEAARANADKSVAEAERVKEQTRGDRLQNDYFESVRDLRRAGEELANNLSQAQWDSIYANIDKVRDEQKKILAETKSEEEKQRLLVEQSLLASEERTNLVELRPFIQAELSARTAEEKASARLKTVDAAYRQGLIDSGSIAAAVRLDNASASEKEVAAATAEFKRAIRTGKVETDSLSEKIVFSLYTGLSNLSAAIMGKN